MRLGLFGRKPGVDERLRCAQLYAMPCHDRQLWKAAWGHSLHKSEGREGMAPGGQGCTDT